MNTLPLSTCRCLILIIFMSPSMFAQEARDSRWQELSSALNAFTEAEPEDLNETEFAQFMLDRAKQAGRLAGEFNAYLKDQPTSHREEAWDTWMDLLNFAATASTAHQRKLEQAEEENLRDPNLSLDQRITIRVNQIDRTSDLKEAENLVRQTQAEIDNIRETLPAESRMGAGRFPHVFFLLNIARYSDHENALRLTQEVIDESKPGNREHEEAMRLKSQLDRIGKKLDLRFPDVNGRMIDVGQFRGKFVLLAYWATWCPPCVAGIPKVKALQEKYDLLGLEVIGMSYDTDEMLLQRFVEKHDVSWPQYFHEMGVGSPIIESLGRPSLPSYWLIDRSGVLCRIGGIDDLNDELKRSLALELKARDSSASR